MFRIYLFSQLVTYILFLLLIFNVKTFILTGAFDQQGCPLVVFPIEAQNKLCDLTKEDISAFINYFLRLHKYVNQTYASMRQ